MSATYSPTGERSVWYNLRRHNPWGAIVRGEVAAYDAECAEDRRERRERKERYAAQLREQMAANTAAKNKMKEQRLQEGERIVSEAQEQLEAERRKKIEDTLRSCSARRIPSPPKTRREVKLEQYEKYKEAMEEQKKFEEDEASSRREARLRAVELGKTLRNLGERAHEERKAAKAARLEEERKLLQQWDDSLIRPDYATFLRQHQKVLPEIDLTPRGKKSLAEIQAEEQAATVEQLRQIEEMEKEELQHRKIQKAKVRADLLRQIEQKKKEKLISTQTDTALRQHLDEALKTSTASARAESIRRQERSNAYGEELKRQMDERCLRDVDSILYPLKAADMTPAPPLPCSPARRRPHSSRCGAGTTQ